jgi:hypothetical protein
MLDKHTISNFKKVTYDVTEYYNVNFFGLRYDNESQLYFPMFCLSENEPTPELIKDVATMINEAAADSNVVEFNHIIFLHRGAPNWWFYRKEELVCIGNHKRFIGKSFLGLYVYDDHVFLNLLPTCK